MKTLILRGLAALLFVLGGSCLVLLAALGVPSFWYLPCVCTLVPIGFVWALKPSIAAPLSVGPLVAAAALIRYQSGIWFAVGATCLIVAIILVFVALRGSRRWKVPMVVSLGFLATAFCTDRLLTNKVTIRTFQMGVALDGKAPWGAVGPAWKDGTPPIVLYRRIGTSYCYVAFESQELRDRLAAKGGGGSDSRVQRF
jgi:hypothetical protein